MIDEERTLKELGIDINVLTKGSNKEVCVICKKCGKQYSMGFVHAKEDKLCLSCVQKGKYAGENSPSWKGGITAWRPALLRTNAYKNWRTAVFKRDSYTCMMCGDKQSGNLEAHHILPIRDHKNDLLVFDINNGITLCKDCYRGIWSREYEHVESFRDMLD